ncbi:MAG: RNA polymerase sigma factor [Planctomycetota bacterium]|jgi:RNA polymerase sigma-70 factor (ECF subfamily)
MPDGPSRGSAEPGDTETDERLFARFLKGDQSGFEALVLRYKDRAFWIAFHMIRDMEESQDLAQEAFARAFIAARSFDMSQKFSTWFFRILVNLCIDTLRKRKTRRTVTMTEPPEVVDGGLSPGEEIHRRELRGRVSEILQILPEKHRTILVLRDIQGLSCIEIAKILRCTHATARWRLHRARGKFREAWEEKFGVWE